MAERIKKTTKKTVKPVIKTAKKVTKSSGNITVHNTNGAPNTTATIVIQNKIKYTPKVSIVIPVYNVEQYLRECLDSVVNQTLHEIEIICVDDGSTDNSLEILKEYATRDNRITVIKQKNLYAGVARNAGMAVARGEYVLFLDSDDWIEQNSLEQIFNTAVKHDVDFIKHKNYTYDETKKQRINSEYTDESSIPNDKFNTVLTIQDAPVCIYMQDSPWSGIYKLSFLKKNKIYFDNYKCVNDVGFFLSIIAHGRFMITDKYRLVNYRVNRKSSLVDIRSDNFNYQIDLYNNCESRINNLPKNIQKHIRIKLLAAIAYRAKKYINNSINPDTRLSVIKQCKKFFKTTDLSWIDKMDNFLSQNDVQNLISIKNYVLSCSESDINVSVIIPVYNVEKYIGQCLDSILNQTLKNIEVICIDDGSTDSSGQIIKDYASKDNRVKFLQQKQQGPSVARNKGMNIATGEFIAFMDSDDFYPDNKVLQDLYNAAKRENVKICGGSLKYLKNGEILPSEPEYMFTEDKKIKFIDYQFDYGFTRFIYNRELLQDNNIKFPDLIMQEDPLFFLNAMHNAGEFYTLQRDVYVYRKSHKVAVWTKEKAIDTAKSLQETWRICEQNGYDKLYITVCNRVTTNYFINIFKTLIDNKGNADKNLVDLINNMDLQKICSLSKDFAFPAFYKSIQNLCCVSVIIPVYNVEKYLAQCLDSVINQTYKNLEIICVNDGSTDGSLKILEKYAKKDKRITIISQENSGLNGARNTGLRNANGLYTTFLDSDDWLDTDWIEKAVKTAIEYNADLVKSGYLHHYKDKIEPDTINKTIDTLADQGKCLGINEHNIIACATLYDMTFIEKNNMYFDPMVRKHEDILYTLKATFLANKIAPLAGTYLNYRRTSSILSLFDKSEYDLLPIINAKAINLLNCFDCEKSDYITAVKRLWWRTNNAYEKRDLAKNITEQELQTYMDKNYAIFRNVKYPNDIFDSDTVKKLNISQNIKHALLVEINDCHGECLPGYAKYLLDLGYHVDILVNKKQRIEEPMQMFDLDTRITTRYLSDQEIFDILNSDKINNYDVCIFNSNILYNYKSQSVFNFIKTKSIAPRILCVEHRLENLPELTTKTNVLVLKEFYPFRNTFGVNPHYFGEYKNHNKNKIINFVIAGNIEKTRKNYDLLIDAVTGLVNKNITNFKITVIGRGNLDNLPQNIKKFFDIKGRVSYPDLYKYVSDADFFLTLLDPEFEEHDRYLQYGTSGSFQLIYGLNIPCLIAEKFAQCHYFSNKNAILYTKNNELGKAMENCINMPESTYQEIKDNLQKTSTKIYTMSLNNLKTAIHKKPETHTLRNLILLPYYLLSNMWMKHSINKRTNFFISLGENCFVRTVLTRHNIKPSKQYGELSYPFDLCVSKLPNINKLIKHNFKNYFDNIEFDNDKGIFVNPKFGLEYNHDTDCNSIDKLINRYIQRIENFKNLKKRKKLAFVFSSVDSNLDYQSVNVFYNTLSSYFKHTNISFTFLDVSKQQIKNYDNLSKEINYKHIPNPYPHYWGEWYKSEFFNSLEGKNFEATVCDFVKKVNANKKSFHKYSYIKHFTRHVKSILHRGKKIKDMPEIYSDVFIPLGIACRPAYWLKHANLRTYTLPFDWMMDYDLNLVINTLKSKTLNWFHDFTEEPAANEKCHSVKDNATQMVSLYHFPKQYDIKDYLPVFTSIFNRRKQRFNNVLSKYKNICFVMNRTDNISAILKFSQDIQSMYPKCRFNIINVRQDNLKTAIYKHRLNKKCVLYDIYYNDICQNISPDEKKWHGNSTLWNNIINKLHLNHNKYDINADENRIYEEIALIQLQNKMMYNNIQQMLVNLYTLKINPEKNNIEFRTFGELAHCIRSNIQKIPNDIDLIVGIPRSGMIPAYITALFMNKKCCSLDEFINGINSSNGFRNISNKPVRNVLIVDDSVHSGKEMTRVREKLSNFKKYNFKYMAVYARTKSRDIVDIYFEIIDGPRLFQWNYLNHSIAESACFDMDGVLCVDPTDEQNDDGEKYTDFIKTAKPLYIPNYKIYAIVTSRLEKYRKLTEKWLADNGVQYDKLIMLDLPNAKERKKLNCHAQFKADVYKKLTDTNIFIESDVDQAQQIATLTGKRVLCVENDEIY